MAWCVQATDNYMSQLSLSSLVPTTYASPSCSLNLSKHNWVAGHKPTLWHHKYYIMSVKTIYKRRKIRLNSQGRGFGVYRSLTKGGGGTSLLGGLPPTRRLSRYVHRVEWREINERSRLSLVCSTPQLARRHGTWNSLSLGGLPPTRRPSAIDRVACQSSQRSYWFMLQRLKKHIMTCILSFPSVIFSEQHDSMVMSAVGGLVCSTPQLARRHGTWNSLSLGPRRLNV